MPSLTSRLAVFVLLGGATASFGFGGVASPAFVTPDQIRREHSAFFSSILLAQTNSDDHATQSPPIIGVVAPLKSVGSYPCLALKFPKGKGEPIFDFLLDTGANINTLDLQLTEEHGLEKLLSSKDLPLIGSAGVGGALAPGDIFLLGDCQLDGVPGNYTFMTNLTAAGLPHASPVGADGLLGVSFFMSFPAGVEFDWHGTDGDPPTIVFYFGPNMPEQLSDTMTRVELELLPVGVFTMNVDIDGTTARAMVDTGSPITVLNPNAAEKAKIETVPLTTKRDLRKRPAIGDEVLTIGGVDGTPVHLLRSKELVSLQVGDISLGHGYVYVGDLPGLALMGAIGDAAPPAAVLGLDSLRRTYRMLLRAPENELWFEALS